MSVNTAKDSVILQDLAGGLCTRVSKLLIAKIDLIYTGRSVFRFKETLKLNDYTATCSNSSVVGKTLCSHSQYLSYHIPHISSLIKILKGSLHLASLLHRPEIGPVKAPGLVVVHPGAYAQRLSQQGYVPIAFDTSHQGSSECLPHYLEDPNPEFRMCPLW